MQNLSSDRDFTVLQVPVVTSVNPRFALSGAVIPAFEVQGVHLTNATFTFAPAFVPPALTINAVSIAPDGRSATLSLTVGANTNGQFVPVASNTAGSSDAFLSPTNTLYILADGTADPDLDALTTTQEIALGTSPVDPDTDGDGFPDGHEVAVGTNPLDAGSVPTVLPPPPTAAQGLLFSVLNATAPDGPPPPVTEALGPIFSVHNEAMP